MTLTTLLPTLRDSIPAPFDRTAWPAGARAGIDDVTVSAISLTRYAEICGTPCVCTGPAVIPFSGGTASPTDSATVVVARVVATDDGTIRIDARLSPVHPVWREARLLGRVSHARDVSLAVWDADADADEPSASVVLPGDVRVGDVIAVPCPGGHSVGEVRVSRRER